MRSLSGLGLEYRIESFRSDYLNSELCLISTLS